MHAYIFDGFPILEDFIRAVNLKGIFAGQILAEKGYKKNERAPGKLLPIESVPEAFEFSSSFWPEDVFNSIRSEGSFLSLTLPLAIKPVNIPPPCLRECGFPVQSSLVVIWNCLFSLLGMF